MSMQAYPIKYSMTRKEATYNTAKNERLHDALLLKDAGIMYTTVERAQEVLEMAVRGEIPLTVGEMERLQDDIDHADGGDIFYEIF